MKLSFSFLLVCVCVVTPLYSETAPPASKDSPVSLFDSVERVKVFLKAETKKDYSDRELRSVRLEDTGKALAWSYYFAPKKRRPFEGTCGIRHYYFGGKLEEAQLVAGEWKWVEVPNHAVEPNRALSGARGSP